MILAFLFGTWVETLGQRCGAQQHQSKLPGRSRDWGSLQSKACSPLQHFQPVNSATLLPPLPSLPWLPHWKKVREGTLTSISVSSPFLSFHLHLHAVLPMSLERAVFPTWFNENCKHLPTDLLPAGWLSVCLYAFSMYLFNKAGGAQLNLQFLLFSRSLFLCFIMFPTSLFLSQERLKLFNTVCFC